MEDWFKWILGGLVGLYSTVTGFVVGLILHDRKRLAELAQRIALVEARQHVDPLEYMQFMTEVKAELKSLKGEAEKSQKETRDLLQRILTTVSVRKDLVR